MPEIFPPRSISISPYVIVPESRPVVRTSSRLRTTRSPSNAPWISACSVALSPLKRPPSLISTSLQSSNFASTVPSTMSRLQEVISPENEVPEPTTIVRISTCLLDGSDCALPFGVVEAKVLRSPGGCLDATTRPTSRQVAQALAVHGDCRPDLPFQDLPS